MAMGMSRRMRGNLLLLLTAAIWGFAFLTQKKGGAVLGDLTFNGLRSFMGCGLLLLLLPLLDRWGLSRKPATKAEKKTLWVSGVLCGLALFAATNLQQLGLATTSSGKGGFITALYIVLVPVFGLAIGRRATLFNWLGVALAMVGMYLLCLADSGLDGVVMGDLLVMACAPMLAVQILLVDRFAPRTDCIRLSCVQFFTVGVLNLPLMFVFETPSLTAVADCWASVLYAGLLSSGVAYTLQIVAQKDTHPTTASVLMSFESVFAVLAGCLLAEWVGLPPEQMTLWQVLGCVVMFGAVILTQLPTPGRKDGKV